VTAARIRSIVSGLSGKQSAVDLQQFYDQWTELFPAEYRNEYLPPLEAAIRADRYYREALPLPKKKKSATSLPPPKVRLLIMSESPAFTSRDLLDAGKDGDYVNLVHCLAYGEPTLLSSSSSSSSLDSNCAGDERPLSSPSFATVPLQIAADSSLPPLNSSDMRKVKQGTPAFWRLLAVLAGKVSSPPAPATTSGHSTRFATRKRTQEQQKVRLTQAAVHQNNDPLSDKDSFDSFFRLLQSKSATDAPARIRFKRSILARLKASGIALIDCSPMPIYIGVGSIRVRNKTTGKAYTTPKVKLNRFVKDELTLLAYREYSSKLIHEIRPERLLILGKSIEQAIGLRTLQDTMPPGCVVLPTLPHPSCCQMMGYNYAPSLRAIRSYAEEATAVGEL